MDSLRYKDKVLTPQEVADILRVTRRTVYAYINNGDIKAINIGARKKGITLAELRRYMKANKID